MARSAASLAPLTVDDLELAMHRVNDYESFGRSIVAQALRSAVQSAALQDGEVRVPTEVVIRSGATPDRDPTKRTVCIDVCVFDACLHVFVE